MRTAPSATGYQLIKFAVDATYNDGFYQSLRNQVSSYFSDQNLSRFINRLGVFKICVFLGAFLGVYVALVFGGVQRLWLSYALWIALGFTVAGVGINICHDAIHGSLVGNQRLNRVFVALFDLIGANSELWKIRHNHIHHTFTNIPHYDDDLNVSPYLRLSPTKPWRSVHRYQHLYAILMYCISSLFWVFAKDYMKYHQLRSDTSIKANLTQRTLIELIFFKLVYYVLFIVLPLVLIPFTWWQVMIEFILFHMVEGVIISIVFMLAHAVRNTQFPYLENVSLVQALRVHYYLLKELGRKPANPSHIIALNSNRWTPSH